MRNQTEFDVSGAFVFSVIENRQSKIQNHLNTLVYGKSPTLVLKETPIKEITFDPSYGSTVRVPHGPEDRRVNSPSRGRSKDSLSQRLIRLRWKLIQKASIQSGVVVRPYPLDWLKLSFSISRGEENFLGDGKNSTGKNSKLT